MSKYFMKNTPLAGFEVAMMLPPLFTNRQCGVIVLNRFHYMKESTNCHDCSAWRAKCELRNCPWLAEWLEADNVSYGELLKECFHDIGERGFQGRLRKLVAQFQNSLFKNNDHYQRFVHAKNNLRLLYGRTSDYHIATIFLLTADERLWHLSRKFVTSSAVNFGAIKLCSIDTEGYTLFQMAKTICTGQTKVTVSELADHTLISDQLLAILINAILIARLGSSVFLLEHKVLEVK
ncbi:MAG: hypothetical protein LBQ71_02950 [Hungatella sp.]|jgi:hypothetical protein|nr:hypothetical protein [Hungatella sp.]